MHRLLGDRLESLYRLYGPETVATDPILFVGRYDAPEDREVAGWIATAFAYGQVRTIQGSVARILGALGPATGDGPRRDRQTSATSSSDALPDFRHRFHGARDAAALLLAIARAREAGGGTLRGFFEGEFRERGPRRRGPAVARGRPHRGLRLPARPRNAADPAALARAVLLSRPRVRLRLQAVEPVPAVDGATRRARLRPVAGHTDRPPGRSDRHPRPPHRPAARPDPPPDRRLEDRPRDHRLARPIRRPPTPSASTTRSAGSAFSTSAGRGWTKAAAGPARSPTPAGPGSGGSSGAFRGPARKSPAPVATAADVRLSTQP